VSVRVLLTDFEPVIANQLHAAAWQHAAALQREVPGIEAFPSWHDSEFGAVTRVLMWPFVRSRLSRIVKRWNDAAGSTVADVASGFRFSPGTWPAIAVSKASLRLKWWPPTRMWPATHHQKMVIVDRHILYTGGLDIDPRRMDDLEHDRPANETWFDCAVLIRGDIAIDAARFFCSLWNEEVARALKMHSLAFARLNLNAPSAMAILPATEPPARLGSGDGNAAKKVRLLLTRSVACPSVFSYRPRSNQTDIKEQVLDWILAARSLVYIETQFLRDRDVGNALLKAAQLAPLLRIVIVMPAAPEVIAFGDPGKADRHGDYLQVSILQKLIGRVGERLTLLSLAQTRAGRSDQERDTLLGAPIIYVHSKLMVIDRRYAIVGSANLNGRSLHTDTEAALALDDRETACALLQTLLNHHTGPSSVTLVSVEKFVDDIDLATQLNRLASRESQRWPQDRETFVLPYPMEIARQTCSRARWIPDQLV